MTDLLTKSADQVSIQDVQSLISLKTPENEQIEFKQAIPDGGNEQWTSKKTISQKATETILKETVAFANAYGGMLILGVAESPNSPPTAERITPIPHCEELAERLPLFFRDLVEPQLTRLEVFPVVTNGDAGVVVVRVGGRSRLSPHRVKRIRVCSIRRQDRCEEMTMREIQDMTLNVSRGLQKIEKAFSVRAENLETEFAHLRDPAKAFGLRITAVPMGDEITFQQVYQYHNNPPDLNSNWQRINLVRENGEIEEVREYPVIRPRFWRPMLRAARADTSNWFQNRMNRPKHNGYKEIHCDGLVELGFVASDVIQYYDNYLSPNLPIVLMANLLVQIDRLKLQAGVPTMEYAVEMQLHAERQVIINNPGPEFGDAVGIYEPSSLTFPRISVRSKDETSDLLSLVQRDFYNMVGADIDNRSFTWKLQDY